MDKSYKRVAWRHHTNVYEVNVRQYSKEGTLNAFAKELPRLKKMGVQTLWFMPLTPISKEKRLGSLGSYYACSDYVSINPEFGTMDDFKQLVSTAHSMGLRIIIDWVANHTGWDHHWTQSHPEYYENDGQGNFKTAHGMADIIELDYNNSEMVSAMIDAMRFWERECNIDGFRCDLAAWVPLEFWRKARTALDANRAMFWLGEFDPLENRDYMEVFDVAYSWTWMHKSEDFYKKQRDHNLLTDTLRRYQTEMAVDTSAIFFTTNHDENSWNGTEFEKYGDMANALAVFSCTWNGIPLLYSGQELPNMKRLKFFDKDSIDWKIKNSMHDFYHKLLALHTSHPALAAADKKVETSLFSIPTDNTIFAYRRKKGEKEVIVLLNFSPYPSKFSLGKNAAVGTYKNLFTGEKVTCDADTKYDLPQWGYAVYSK